LVFKSSFQLHLNIVRFKIINVIHNYSPTLYQRNAEIILILRESEKIATSDRNRKIVRNNVVGVAKVIKKKKRENRNHR